MRKMEDGNRKQGLGLYIHIPFCVRKCLYCDFLSMAAGDDIKERYIQALLRELEAWKGILRDYRLKTIFVGGGTPTCLSPGQMERFFQGLLRTISPMDREEEAEFTVEANPGTVLPGHLALFGEAGVNRVSLGLQSAQDGELRALGRIHGYQDFLATYGLLREQGFSNVNVDLMSAIPGQSLESYEDTLKKVVSLRPEHISAYSLQVEEGTPFGEMEERGALSLPSEEMDRQMYGRTKEFLEEAGFVRYEISNYARPGFACRHNLTYWDTGAYLGVGLGASSCLGGYRFQNTEDMEEYLAYFDRDRYFGNSFEAMENWNGKDAWENFRHLNGGITNHMNKILEGSGRMDVPDKPILQGMQRWTETARMEEFMFLGLRKMEGISAADFLRRFGKTLGNVYGEVLPGLIGRGLLRESEDGEQMFLTERGIDVSNVVLAEFLLSD